MNPKEINRESGPMFEILLLPNWARRSQQDQEDYGVDYELELMTPEDKATGFIFKVQLKGTRAANYDKSGQLVFSEASVERFKYYINELRIPLVFVVCDVATGECFWTKVQGNRQLESDLNDAAAKNQKTFTIRFSATRILQKNEATNIQIIEAVESALDTITLRGLQAISPASVRDHIGHEPDIESTEKRFRLFAGLAAAEAIKKMVESGTFADAEKKARVLLGSDAEPPAVRILAGISLVHTNNAQIKNSSRPDRLNEGAKFKLETSLQMLRISRARSCENRWKRYTCIYTRATRMQLNGRVAYAHATSENPQIGGGTVSTRLTNLQLLQVSALVSKDFFKLLRDLHNLGKKGFFSVMPYALAEIAEAIFPFVSSLRILGRADLADGYIDALFDFLPFCMEVVRKTGNASDNVEILNSLGIRFVGLANVSDKGSINSLISRFEGAMTGTPIFAGFHQVIDGLKRFFDQVVEGIGPPPSKDQLLKHYAEEAAKLGINLNDPNSDHARVIRIGLDDIDPTRVVKKCRHIHVVIIANGALARRLDLPTAGFKRVICLKYGQSAEALSLDDAYETFASISPHAKDQICCENCSTPAPHPDGWNWSQDWQKQQADIYKKVFKDVEL
jgi:hypothetical protein